MSAPVVGKREYQTNNMTKSLETDGRLSCSRTRMGFLKDQAGNQWQFRRRILRIRSSPKTKTSRIAKSEWPEINRVETLYVI